MRSRNILLVVCLALSSPGSSAAQQVARATTDVRTQGSLVPQGEVSAVRSPDELLGAEDLLDIKVVGVEALSSTVRIAASGNITFPLIGEVRATGLTRSDLERSIAALLEEKYVNDPQVAVFVREHGSRKVSVLGAVAKPGRYSMVGRRTLLDLISDAGGLAEDAGPHALITHRSAAGSPGTTSVSLKDLLYGGHPELNVEIGSGDMIHIPIDREQRVFVDGAVRNPGEFATPESRPLTVLRALAKAGGLTERAALKRVEVLRMLPDGEQKSIPINLRAIRRGTAEDVLLEDGDIIVVPETFF